jgi:hypothetical protein
MQVTISISLMPKKELTEEFFARSRDKGEDVNNSSDGGRTAPEHVFITQTNC